MTGSPADRILAGRGPFDDLGGRARAGARDPLDVLEADIAKLPDLLPSRLDAEPEDVEKGLTRLVLTVVELLRQIMERQALRRVDSGALNDDQVERLGQALLALSERMEELKRELGLEDEDLNLDLGPLGKLM